MQNEHIIELTRQDLLDLVWSKPMREAAPGLGVSDTGLRKVCRRHCVPRPPPGYFLMKEERKPATPELPAIESTRMETIRFFVGRRSEDPSDTLPADIQGLVDAESSPEWKISVADRLTRPHPFVDAVRRDLMSQKKPSHGAPILVSGDGRPRVRVTRASLPRAMRILDALLKAADARGLSASVKDRGHKRECVLEVCGEQISFRLSEKLRRLEVPAGTSGYSWSRYEYEPTGQLQLEIDSYCERVVRRRWRDGRRRRVEDCLNEFFVSALQAAAGERRRTERWEAEERERERRAQERAERERLIREEAGRVKALVDDVAAWHLARRMREYVKVVGRGESKPSAEWSGWALAQADRIDPTVPSPASILDMKEEGDDESPGWLWPTTPGSSP